MPKPYAVHWWCLALIPAYTLGFTMAYSLVFIKTARETAAAKRMAIAATWGDLFESMIKRQVGVKDSGNIICATLDISLHTTGPGRASAEHTVKTSA